MVQNSNPQPTLPARCLELIEQGMRSALDRIEIVEQLRPAVEHILFPPGKRIRPQLCLVLCHELGGQHEALLPAAVALELIHCSSLIHDDLPAMDDDDMRRGRPTCHIVYGEAAAILAGDFLVALAINNISEAALAPDIKMRLVSVLTETYMQLCNGQQLDLSPDDERGSLERIHALKTGSLFRATAQFAAEGAGVAQQLGSLCQELGELVGVCFQVVDDFIDLYGSNVVRGRNESSDARNKKTTFCSGDLDRAKFMGMLEGRRRQLFECIAKIEAAAGAQAFPHTRTILESIFQRADLAQL